MSSNKGTVFLCLIVACVLQWSPVSGCSEKDRLVRDLTTSYLKSVEPDKAVLKAGLALVCSRYDKITGQLTTSAWEKYTWTDKRLSWNPKDYNGIDTLRLPVDLIWAPDFKLYNSLKAVEERDRTHTYIKNDGTVIWIPTVVYRTYCTSDPSGLNCQLVTGSWTYDADTIKVELDEKGIELDTYLTTCPLAVESATAELKTKHYPCCQEPYSSIEFNIRLKPQTV